MLDKLQYFWSNTATQFDQLAGKQLWMYQNLWRHAFAGRYYAVTKRWPEFRTEDEFEAVLCGRYNSHCAFRAAAEDNYAAQESSAPLNYVLFTLLKTVAGFACTGKLPPLHVLSESVADEKSAGRVAPAFLVSNIDFTWTALFPFSAGNAVFVTRDEFVDENLHFAPADDV